MATKKSTNKANQPKMVIVHRPTMEQVIRYVLTGAAIFLFINFQRYGFSNLTETEIIEALYFIGIAVGMWAAWGFNKSK